MSHQKKTNSRPNAACHPERSERARTYRQGDVLLVAIAALPAALTPVPADNGRTILAYGEVTGHAHAIVDGAVLFERAGITDRFLEVTEPTTLSHEEHDPMDIPPGNYAVRIQREHDLAEGFRRVAD